MKFIYSIFIFLFLSLFFITSVNAYDPLTVPNNIYGIGVVNHSDLEDVSNLVNVNGGDWGYVTIVITEDNRNKEVWQGFLDECRRKHLIPIIRVATTFKDGNWSTPNIDSVDSWVSFFDSLNWVIENRYIVVGNEPNHAKEWGGKIKPNEYALFLKAFADKLHRSTSDYFVLNAGFDQAAANTKVTMDEKKYILEMSKAVPDVFNSIDGWSSHSYPNPGFSGLKTDVGRKSIRGYEWELEMINRNLPVFITETGWVRNNKNQNIIADNLKYAFENVWIKDKRVVAVTPFILNYQSDPFYEFSWKNKDGSYFPIYSEIQNLQKIKGVPTQKISGHVIFSFLSPFMFKNTEQKGFSVVRNTGQAIWVEGESHIINDSNNEIKVSNTKFGQIEPFNSGLVVYTLKAPDSENITNIKLGFYVRGIRIGDVFNGKIISF